MVADGYKQTEVGVIPEDWEVIEARSICSVNQGLQISIDNRLKTPSHNSKKYLTIQYLNDGKKAEYIETYSSSVCCDEQDVLMTRTGNTGVIVTGVEGVFHNNFFKISFDRKKLARDYFTSYLNQSWMQNLILSKAGTSTIPDLNHAEFYSLPILLPTLAEQEAIAGALSDADGLIESLEQLIEKKRQIKQGAMQDLLSPWEKATPAMDNGKVIINNDSSAQHSQLSTINSPLKPSTPKLKVGWVEKTLGEVLVGKELGGNYQNSEEYGGEVLIKMGNIARNHISLKKVEKMVTGFSPNSSHRLNYGDVLFNTRNTLDLVGKVSIWRSEVEVAYYNSNLMRMTFCPKLVESQFFMNYLLNTKDVIAQLRGVAIGTTSVAAIYSRDFSSIILHLPSRDEQVRIAVILDDMDEGICVLESKLFKAKQIKQGMMQELLTGKTRLI